MTLLIRIRLAARPSRLGAWLALFGLAAVGCTTKPGIEAGKEPASASAVAPSLPSPALTASERSRSAPSPAAASAAKRAAEEEKEEEKEEERPPEKEEEREK